MSLTPARSTETSRRLAPETAASAAAQAPLLQAPAEAETQAAPALEGPRQDSYRQGAAQHETAQLPKHLGAAQSKERFKAGLKQSLVVGEAGSGGLGAAPARLLPFLLETNFERNPPDPARADQRLDYLDQSVPAGPMAPAQMEQLRSEVHQFFDKDLGPHESSKERLLEAVARQSKNPNLRAAFEQVGREYHERRQDAALEQVLRNPQDAAAVAALDAAVGARPDAAEAEQRLQAGLERMLQGSRSEQDKAQVLGALLEHSKNPAVRRQAETEMVEHVHRLAEGGLEDAARFAAGTEHPRAQRALARALEARVAGAAPDGPEARLLAAELGRQLKDPALKPQEKARFAEGVLQHAESPAVRAAMAEALGENLSQLGGRFEAVGLLLGKDEDPKVQEALARGLDRTMTSDTALKSEADRAAARRLTQELGAFLQSGTVSPENRIRLAEVLAASSKKPNVRSAMTLALSSQLNSLASELDEKQRRLRAIEGYEALDPATRGNDRSSQPLPPWIHDQNYRQQLERDVPQLQAFQLQGQAALAGLLVGRQEHDDSRKPQSQLGSLHEFLRQAYEGQMVEGAQSVMRALFAPPSAASLRFEEITRQAVTSTNEADAAALGFFVEAGRQALEVEPQLQKKADREMLLLLGGAVLQIALAGGLGAFEATAAERLGLTGEAADAFGAALGKAGEEGLNLALGTEAIDLLLRKLQDNYPGSSLKGLRGRIHAEIQDSAAARAYREGVQAALGRSEEQREGY